MTNMLLNSLTKSQRILFFPLRTLASLPTNTTDSFHRHDKNGDIDSALDPSIIQEAIKASPILSTASKKLWQESHRIFIDQGFDTRSFFKLIVDNPALINRQASNISRAMESWRACQFGDLPLKQLLCRHPELLDISDQRRLFIKMGELKTLVATEKNVWKLLMNCPTLIRDNWVLIVKKFEYLKNVMRLELPDIVNSEALAQSFEEIQCRHVFLERLTVFERRSLKADPKERSKNPKLSHIMDTSEKRFATKVAFVTLDEYEAFKDLFKRELENAKDDDDDEDDNDSDSDDSDNEEIAADFRKL